MCLCLCLCLCLCASETVYVFGPLLATVVNRPLWFDFPKLPLPVIDCALNLLILGTRLLKVWLCWHHSKPEGEVLAWINFGWVCAAGVSEPLPYYSLFCDHLFEVIDPVIFGKEYVVFSIPTQSLSIFVSILSIL